MGIKSGHSMNRADWMKQYTTSKEHSVIYHQILELIELEAKVGRNVLKYVTDRLNKRSEFIITDFHKNLISSLKEDGFSVEINEKIAQKWDGDGVLVYKEIYLEIKW